MPDAVTDDEAFTVLLRMAQEPDVMTGHQPSDKEIAAKLGCGVRRVRNHPSYIDSLHWKREMEKARPRRRAR
jgi:hypothetical protein